MTAEDLINDLQRAIRDGRISRDTPIYVRNSDVSEAAMEAGSDGYAEAEDVLYPGDGRVVLLGES